VILELIGNCVGQEEQVGIRKFSIWARKGVHGPLVGLGILQEIKNMKKEKSVDMQVLKSTAGIISYANKCTLSLPYTF
jgi:hypothetical protein